MLLSTRNIILKTRQLPNIVRTSTYTTGILQSPAPLSVKQTGTQQYNKFVDQEDESKILSRLRNSVAIYTGIFASLGAYYSYDMFNTDPNELEYKEIKELTRMRDQHKDLSPTATTVVTLYHAAGFGFIGGLVGLFTGVFRLNKPLLLLTSMFVIYDTVNKKFINVTIE